MAMAICKTATDSWEKNEILGRNALVPILMSTETPSTNRKISASAMEAVANSKMISTTGMAHSTTSSTSSAEDWIKSPAVTAEPVIALSPVSRSISCTAARVRSE